MPLHEFSRAAATSAARANKPNDALQRAAGAFAAAIAMVWPRPHAEYFQLSQDRRHLAHLVAARRMGVEPLASLSEPLGYWSVRRVLAAYLPGAPAGFAEALRKLEGEGWEMADYSRLLGLLGEGGHGAKLVRHAPAITRLDVAIVSVLPGELRRPRLVALLRDERLARLAARGAQAAVKDEPAQARAAKLAALGDRLERAGSTDAVFAKLVEEVHKQGLADCGPIPGTSWLKPIATSKEMASAALRFQNCLRDRTGWLLKGAAAYFELREPEPGIIEILKDPGSGEWRFGEMRGMANRDLSSEALARVRVYLEGHGAKPWRRDTVSLLRDLAVAAGF